MENRHQPYDLAQMQSLPLETKIRMSKERIEAWYESWCKFEIYDAATGKTRFATIDRRDYGTEPPMKDTECVISVYPGQVYVSFSGGKDSTVLKHIVDSMYDDVPAVFVNTGLEYPEIQKFAMSQKNVITVRPEMRFDEVLTVYGYPVIGKAVAHNVAVTRRNPDGAVAKNIMYNPDRTGLFNHYKWNFLVDAPFLVSEKCCDVMKKSPAKKYRKETGRMPILGTMANESKLRYAAWLKNGCNAFEGSNPLSAPLSFWTEQDILEYLVKYNVPYCSVYGDIIGKQEDNEYIFSFEELAILYQYLTEQERMLMPTIKLKTTGCDRTGCIFCMFGCHREKEPNRFQMLKETHPRQYEYCIGGGEMVDGKWQPSKEGLGLGKVLDYIGVKYD